MKKIILACFSVLSLTAVNAQTVNTEVQSGTNNAKVVAKPGQTTDARAERMASRMRTELGLNDDQYTKIVTLKKETYANLKTQADKYPGVENRDARIVAVRGVRDTYVTALKGILTPEQYAKHDANIKTRFEAWKAGANAQPNGQKQDEEAQQIKMQIE